MRLYISFSARKDGNSDEIAKYLCKEGDRVVFFRDINVNGCKDCNYECFKGYCKYHSDGVYDLYDDFKNYEKVVLIVPMYCGNPSSLYFTFNERGQDFFMHNEREYENIIKRLFIIGVYGDWEQSPDFIPCLEKWFSYSKYSNHVLGLERHRYNLKLTDSILAVPELKERIDEFINPTKAKLEESAMAVVTCGNKILATREIIYGKETLSLPKGHREAGETLLNTAIRECFEETNISITMNNFVKELPAYSYEFLTPSNQLIRKTVTPFLFSADGEGNPLSKEKRIVAVQWMNIGEFIDGCTHEAVKKTVKIIK